ncbi:chemotaxis protein CheW [Bacillus sp. V59.32b]|uniref:chemotaxis protein CheW n=1 Tax=Bacillus sp. V59.32b TaxID=1758642 RepID=UPI000E3BE29C|nr:chemotaxis protein CheW [Bacillus sp. V59.32b]RFU66814.1 purine-binding chemotaxis protein CheW [Bacillus sp. V59.32b]
MNSLKYIVFRIGNQDFGVPVSFVISIEKVIDLSDFPQMPKYVKGLTTIRDAVVPVLDMSQILFNRTLETNEDGIIILIDINGSQVGMMVNEAKEILDVPESEVKEIDGLFSQNASYLIGVVRANDTLINLLNPIEMLQNIDGIDEIIEQSRQTVN